MILVKSNCPRFTINKKKAQVEGPGLLEDERTFFSRWFNTGQNIWRVVLKRPDFPISA